MMEKLNMVIGVFFSEVGTELMGAIVEFDPDTVEIRHELMVKTSWSRKNFQNAKKRLKHLIILYILTVKTQNP